jgi:hypothetical protein
VTRKNRGVEKITARSTGGESHFSLVFREMTSNPFSSLKRK